MYGIFVIYEDTMKNQKHIISYATDVSSFSFFKRNGIKEMMRFSARETTELLEEEQKYALDIEDKVCFALKKYKGCSFFAFCHNSFDQKTAFALLRKYELTLKSFMVHKKIHLTQVSQDLNIKDDKFKEILIYGNNMFKEKIGEKLSSKEQMVNDKMKKEDLSIQNLNKKVEENKQIMHKNMMQLLENNKNIDKLIEESLDLKTNTKMFLKKSKKMNSCC